MTEPEDLVLKILTAMREDMSSMREDMANNSRRVDERFNQLQAEMSEMREDIAATNEQITEVEVRLATEIVDVAAAIRQLTTTLVSQSDLRPKVNELDRRVTTLESQHE